MRPLGPSGPLRLLATMWVAAAEVADLSKGAARVQQKVDLLSQLAVAMVTEVLDGQVLDLRSSSKADPHLLRLGNTAANEEKDSITGTAGAQPGHSGRQGQRCLEQKAPEADDLVEGSMPQPCDGADELGTAAPEEVARPVEYQDEFANDILSVAAGKEKRDQLREIEETIQSELKAPGLGWLGSIGDEMKEDHRGKQIHADPKFFGVFRLETITIH
eukprot:Skav205869  [mRNA]  locus=scaffold766:191772:193450:+ [translate_table: standard]